MSSQFELLGEMLNAEVFGKMHSALDKAVEELDFFSSNSIKVDRSFNRKHLGSAFFDLPSPPPFSVNKDAEYMLKAHLYGIHSNKPASRFQAIRFEDR